MSSSTTPGVAADSQLVDLDPTWGPNWTPETPFGFIKDIVEVDKFSPSNVDKLISKYPLNVEDKKIKGKHQDYIYATVIFCLAADLTSLFPDALYNATKQAHGTYSFETYFHVPRERSLHLR